MSEAARRGREDVTPDEMDDVADRLREYGFGDVAEWIEERADAMREGDADGR